MTKKKGLGRKGGNNVRRGCFIYRGEKIELEIDLNSIKITINKSLYNFITNKDQCNSLKITKHFYHSITNSKNLNFIWF